MTRWLLPACVAAALFTAACGEPPNKEMAQAQGAIDAARAAGAERYATDEYKAAVDSLRQSEVAVGERDYRLALSNALESREHAQNAARDAADTKARLRGDVERRMAEIGLALADVNARLRMAEAARVPRRLLAAPQREVANITAEVQKVGAAIRADDYIAVQPMLVSVKARLDKVAAELEAQPAAQTAPRRR